MQPCGWPSTLSSTAFILNLSRIDDEGSRVTGAGLCVSRTVRSMASTRAAHERFRASVPATAYFKLIFWRGSRRRRARASSLFCWRLTGCRTQQPATAARFERPVCVPVTAVLVIRGGQRLCAAVQGWGTEGVGQSAGVFCPRPSLACASKAICAALVELCLRLEIHPSKSACVYRTARDNFRNTGPQPVTRILLR